MHRPALFLRRTMTSAVPRSLTAGATCSMVEEMFIRREIWIGWERILGYWKRLITLHSPKLMRCFGALIFLQDISITAPAFISLRFMIAICFNHSLCHPSRPQQVPQHALFAVTRTCWLMLQATTNFGSYARTLRNLHVHLQTFQYLSPR